MYGPAESKILAQQIKSLYALIYLNWSLLFPCRLSPI